MWQPLSEIESGDLFETEDGKFYLLDKERRYEYEEGFGGEPSVAYSVYSARMVGSGTYIYDEFNKNVQVRKLDLAFLILCVTDKLHENDAYQRGVRDVQVSADRVKKCLARMFAWQSGINELMPDDLSAEVRSILGVRDVEEILFGKTYHETKLPVQND